MISTKDQAPSVQRQSLYYLTKASSPGAYSTTFQYAYDAVGNRTTQTATITSTQVTNYIYDAANRLASVNGQAYAWDDNGNLVNDGTSKYRYDQAGHLISATLGSMTSLFNYNGDGARLKQIVNGTVTIYTQDPSAGSGQALAAPLPVVLQSKTGTNATRYVYTLGTRPLAQYGTAWEYLLPDALGSVRQIVDANGNVTLAESYEPYGSVLTTNGTASSIFAYAGEQIDTSGLIYLRARYMNPRLGIFLARDPWSGDVMRPGSMNGWVYAEDNPVVYIDPSGKFRFCEKPFDLIAKIRAAILIDTSKTAGERLRRLFADDFHECDAWLCAGRTTADRLDFVLDFTQGLRTGVPSLGFPAQFYIDFGGDSGLAEELRDSKYYKGNNPQSSVWEGSTNQPGHFLTAVALSYRGLPEAFHLFFWSPAADPARKVSYEDRIALGLIVGHEKVSDDNSKDPILAAQRQYWSASEQDINDFMDAVGADERGDKQTRDDIFWRILGPSYKQNIQNRVGNSIEDLRLSAKGWRFGKWVLNNKDAPSWLAADWLLENILGGWTIASSSP